MSEQFGRLLNNLNKNCQLYISLLKLLELTRDLNAKHEFVSKLDVQISLIFSNIRFKLHVVFRILSNIFEWNLSLALTH